MITRFIIKKKNSEEYLTSSRHLTYSSDINDAVLFVHEKSAKDAGKQLVSRSFDKFMKTRPDFDHVAIEMKLTETGKVLDISPTENDIIKLAKKLQNFFQQHPTSATKCPKWITDLMSK